MLSAYVIFPSWLVFLQSLATFSIPPNLIKAGDSPLTSRRFLLLELLFADSTGLTLFRICSKIVASVDWIAGAPEFMKILFALAGLHRHDRGAEQAFISIASELVKTNDSVTLIGSGRERQATPYRFLRAVSLRRERFERFPSLPGLRDECGYEELTFVPDFLRRYRPADYDIVVTCGYPFINWMLRRPVLWGRKPRHVFVTQNGDWAAQARNSEFRFFRCDGLVCTNPEFYRRNRDRWLCKLIPNGVDFDRFSPGLGEREEFGLPKDRRIVLMVSALIPTKRVEVGIAAVARVPNAHLVVAGDGPLRETIAATAAELLPGRLPEYPSPERKCRNFIVALMHFCIFPKTSLRRWRFLKRLRADFP
jgi:glycosyltransferase involved in cell wall biosynthesis